MATLIEQISQKLLQAPESLLQEVLEILHSVGRDEKSSSIGVETFAGVGSNDWLAAAVKVLVTAAAS